MKNFFELKNLNSKKIDLQVLLNEFSVTTMPKWVGFTTTTFCNLRCPHCNTHGTEEARAIYQKQHWDHDFTLKIANETLPTAEGFCLTLSGEPLATPRFRDLLAKLRPYGAKLHLTTNGVLLSRKILTQLLPIVSAIDISIDGSSKSIIEATRLGIRFEDLIKRIKVLTRSCELLEDIIRFPIRLAYTVMGSNIRDMPGAVKLAHLLGVRGIDFYPLRIFSPSVADESIDLYLPLYKAYHQRTIEEGEKWGVSINFLLPEYPDVQADPNFSTSGKNLIASLSCDYYENLPPPESYLDMESIDLEAADISSIIRNEIPPTTEPFNDRNISDFLHEHEKALSELIQKPDFQLPWCNDLDTRIFIDSTGEAAPCCMPERPNFGNIYKETVSQIWNGPVRADFWRRFHSSEQPECCKNCRSRTTVSSHSLLRKIGMLE